MRRVFKTEQADYLKNECEQMPVLRTFLTFKQFNAIPAFITKPITFFQRRAIAKLRLGSLELKIQTGRFSRPRLEINERFCAGCKDHYLSNNLEQQIETEYHFIFVCICYVNLRTTWLSKLTKPENFDYLNMGEKLSIVLNLPENIKSTGQFINDAFSMRNKIINT